MKTRTIAVKSDDEPRGVLAEQLVHDVTLAEVTLNLLQRELLQFRDAVLGAISVLVHGDHKIRRNLVGHPVDGFW